MANDRDARQGQKDPKAGQSKGDEKRERKDKPDQDKRGSSVDEDIGGVQRPPADS